MPISRFITDLDQLIAEFNRSEPASTATYDELRLAVARLNEISRQLDIAYRKIEPVIALAEMEVMHGRVNLAASQQAVNDRFLVHDNCLTGHPRIDRDHRELIEIGNRVFRLSCTTHISGEQVLDVLSDFLAHCRDHFAYEEALMESCGLPDTVAHQASHRRMLDYIEEMRALALGNPMAVAIKMDKFIGSWFTWHMQRDDMALAQQAGTAI